MFRIVCQTPDAFESNGFVTITTTYGSSVASSDTFQFKVSRQPFELVTRLSL